MHVESIPPHPHSRPKDVSVNCSRCRSSFSNNPHLDQVHVIGNWFNQVRFPMYMDLMIPTIFPDLASGWIVSCCHRHRHIYHVIHSQTISTATVPSLILPGYSAHRSTCLRSLYLVIMCQSYAYLSRFNQLTQTNRSWFICWSGVDIVCAL